MVILKTESLNKTNDLTTESTIFASEYAHVSINTVYGAWTVSKSKFELYKWNFEYICNGQNYSIAKKPSQILLSPDIENSLLSPMTKYKRNNSDDKIRRLVESQEQQIANRSKLVDAYISQIERFFEATKKGSNLFNRFFNGIVKLLPTNSANFIKRFLLVVNIIIAVLIEFLLLLITCKCLSFLWWCYVPVFSRIAGLARGTRSVGSGVGRALESLTFNRVIIKSTVMKTLCTRI